LAGFSTRTDPWLRKSPLPVIIDLHTMSCGLKKSLPSFKQALKARTHKSQVVELFTLTFLRLFRVDIMGVQKDSHRFVIL
jgi:hypothetical protein